MTEVVADYAHTEWANRKRREKALTLAKYLYEQGLRTADVLTMLTAERKAVEKACDVRTSHRDELWGLVVEALDDREDWDAQHPPPRISEPEPAPGGGLPPLPCGCPGAAVIPDQDAHRAFHDLVEQQTGIAWGQLLTMQTLQQARGYATAAPDQHIIAERHRRQGKTASADTRRRLRG